MMEAGGIELFTHTYNFPPASQEKRHLRRLSGKHTCCTIG
jgi:hypothetical protein